MGISRRRALGLFGSTLAAPSILRTNNAYAAAPKLRRVGDKFALGSGLPGGKYNVALSAFSKGGYVAGFLNDRGGGDTRAYIQYFGNDNTPLSSEIQMGAATGLTDGIPANSIFPVANPNGSSVAFFGAATNGGTALDQMDIFMQRMTAGMAKIGDAIRINTKTTDLQDQILATRLTNGNYMVVWSNQGVTQDSYDIRGRVMASNGSPVSNEALLNIDTPGLQFPTSLAPLPDGESLLGYYSLFPSTPKWKVEVQRFGANGHRVANPYVVKAVKNALFGAVGFPLVVPKPEAETILGWYTRKTDTEAELEIQRYQTGAAGVTQPVHSFPIDLWFDGSSPDTPKIVKFHDPNVGDLLLITHYALHVGERIINGAVVKLPATFTGVPLDPPGIEVRRSVTGLHPTNDALIPLSDKNFVAGFSEGDGDPAHTKAYVQRLNVDVM